MSWLPSFSAYAFGFGLAAGLAAGTPSVSVKSFGKLHDGRETHLYSLKSDSGFQADISDYGGIIVRILAPDRAGKLADVALGFGDVSTYVKQGFYIGALIGRVTNRIAGATFVLDGRTYNLTANETLNGVASHLHGGARGFSRVLWIGEPTTRDGRPALRLRYTSADGEEGYPGTLHIEVLYSLTRDQGLRIDFTATTDKPTPVNLTSHAAFNLAGEGNGTVLDHEVTIRARRYTPFNDRLVPTGEIAPVAGTPLDFTAARRVGAHTADGGLKPRLGGGYDNNYVLDGGNAALAPAATAFDPATGRLLEVLTTEPGMHFFTCNGFDGGLIGKSGRRYPRHAGLCFETQHFPDSVHHPSFPGIILRPGKTFHSATVFRFSTR